MVTRKPHDDDQGDARDVIAIDSVVDTDLDLEPDQDGIPPFRVRLGGETFVLDQPDTQLVMELEESTTSRGYLALIFDDQWKTVYPLLAPKHPDVMVKLVRDYGQHYGIDHKAMIERAAPNRAERRRRPRRR